jgi:hypothetical protein
LLPWRHFLRYSRSTSWKTNNDFMKPNNKVSSYKDNYTRDVIVKAKRHRSTEKQKPTQVVAPVSRLTERSTELKVKQSDKVANNYS